MSRIRNLAMNDEGFIFDPATGNSYTVNQTGLFILKQLKNGKSEDEIIDTLCEEFEVNTQEAQRDVMEFVSFLKTLGLMEE